ncbi:hypothetical protein KM043_012497 [Ampulex compressa]|nr:hypothetical protein KM043_012497 [Ampulex compressa]
MIVTVNSAIKTIADRGSPPYGFWKVFYFCKTSKTYEPKLHLKGGLKTKTSEENLEVRAVRPTRTELEFSERSFQVRPSIAEVAMKRSYNRENPEVRGAKANKLNSIVLGDVLWPWLALRLAEKEARILARGSTYGRVDQVKEGEFASGGDVVQGGIEFRATPSTRTSRKVFLQGPQVTIWALPNPIRFQLAGRRHTGHWPEFSIVCR